MGIDDDVARRADAALAALSELTPGTDRTPDAASIPLDWFRWLDHGLNLLQGMPMPDPGQRPSSDAMALIQELVFKQEAPLHESLMIDRDYGERLAAVQQLREGRHSVRIGWLWLAGTTTVSSSTGSISRRRIFQPLVTRTVRVLGSSKSAGWTLTAYGDIEITPLVEDREVARSLESRVEYGGGAFRSTLDLTPALLDRLPRLRGFALDCARATGHVVKGLVTERMTPDALMAHDGLRVVVGLGVYTTDEPSRTSRAGALRAWSSVDVDQPTAFHTVYGGSTPAHPTDDRPVESPLPLSRRQTEAVRLARSSPLTVISGAPGTGKSHTLVAIVCDALARGKSVLVAAKDDAAIEAVATLLGRQPGITPVVFGSSEQRERLALRLANGELVPCNDDVLDEARDAFDRATHARDLVWSDARRSLFQEWRRTPEGLREIERIRSLAPVAPPGPAPTIDALLTASTDERPGWFAGRSRRRAERRLRAAVGAADHTPLPQVIDAIHLARQFETVHGADRPTAAITAELERAEEVVRQRFTEWLALDIRSSDRLDRTGLAAVNTLATALRSGRSARRAQLERLRDRSLSRALPLWMGTLADVDDLLPTVPGLFDLVLIDEASATEQTLAAPALLRGRQAVVVGDPRQLRHVSFVSDATIEEVLDRTGVEPAMRSQLDVRRNSVFDAAAAASPVHMLDEHFRSAPHLIDVVARTLYDGRLHVATRSPVTQHLDCVHLMPVAGTRGPKGVVAEEVREVLVALRRFGSGPASVGVVTPFRAQADAIEEALLASFDAHTLVRLGVRVGTVHSFQGNERHSILCSLGLVDGDAGGWSFVADPHLLAVMLTRARTSMTIISSCSPEPDSLLGAYLATADSPPGAPAPARPLGRWAAAVVADLRLAGLSIHEAYPTGRHVIDAVTETMTEDGVRPVAIICELHPDGIDDHLDRHLSLQRAGWQVVDALESMWEHDAAERVVELARTLRQPS